MSSFKKLNTKIYQKPKTNITSDFLYWKQLEPPVLVKEFGPIDCIDFSPVEPYYFAVTCSVRVQVYNPITKLVAKNLSRFRENAYGGVFRSDGRLLATGGEEKNVKLFDISTKSLLRLFKGHTSAVHKVCFMESHPYIASFSDDKSVKVWDIATENNILTFAEHTDYIRAGTINKSAPDILISGGYDGIVNMYDTRTNTKVLNVNHGPSIEALLFLPSGGIFLSAGGTEIKIWDSIAGGRLLGTISQHHKTITCLQLASDNKRLLSGSLDHHVKIYDLKNYKVVHNLDYPNAILSLGISKNDDTLAVGLVDGLVSISRRTEPKVPIEKKKNISFQHLIKQHQSVDLAVPQIENSKETRYDKCLRKFEYAKALDSVLLAYVATKTPEVTVSVIQELIKRKAFDKALRARSNPKTFSQILRFFLRNITEIRFTKILLNAVHIFLDIIENNPIILDSEVRNLLHNLTQLLRDESNIVDQQTKLHGMMHLILSAACSQTLTTKMVENLKPSVEAQKNLIVNLT